MSRLSEIARRKEEARAALEEAKHEMHACVVEIVEDNGECYARDIAERAGLNTCEVIGALQSALYRGDIDTRNGVKRIEYVRLLPDGSVNMDDKLVREYRAKVYVPVDRRRR